MKDIPSATCNCELILVGAPAYECRGAIDTQEYQGGLPYHMARLRVGGLRPDIGIPVLRRGYDSVGVGGPVDGSDGLIVL